MSEVCITLESNVNQGSVKSYGQPNTLFITGKKPTAITETAAKLKSTWESLMLKDIVNGRLFIIKEADIMEPGTEEPKTATSNNGDIVIGKKLAQHKYTFYVDDCGMRSLLKAFGEGTQVYILQGTDGGYLRGKKNPAGSLEFIKAYIHAIGLEPTESMPDAVSITLSIREDYKANQYSVKPDFDITELNPIQNVNFSNGIATASNVTIEFDAEFCSGCRASDFDLANLKFYNRTENKSMTADTVTITNGVVKAILTALDFSALDILEVSLDTPENTLEFYETSKVYEITAGA